MKQLFIYSLLILTIASSCTGEKAKEEAEPVDSLAVLITMVRTCSRLYTAEYRIHKIITHSDNLKLKGTFLGKKFDANLPFGERNIAIPMNAVLKGCIDFGGFSESNVKKNGNKIEIILPDPQVILTSTKIDHERIMQNVPMLRSDFTDKELSNYEQQGRNSIIKSIPRLGIVEKTRDNAARTLIPLIEKCGYKRENVTISFRKDFKGEDIPQLIRHQPTGK